MCFPSQTPYASRAAFANRLSRLKPSASSPLTKTFFFAFFWKSTIKTLIHLDMSLTIDHKGLPHRSNSLVRVFHCQNPVLNTRHAHSQNFYLERKNKTTDQRSHQYREAKLWKKVLNSMKLLSDVHAFATSFKRYLIALY